MELSIFIYNTKTHYIFQNNNKSEKLNKKKWKNFIFNIIINFFAFFKAIFGTFMALRLIISYSDNAKLSNIIPKKYDIIEEYLILRYF